MPILNTATPLYFPSEGHTLFGWMHAPDAAAAVSSWGLLLCYPFGYEAICSHRALRTIAEKAASLGIAALRFDYVGAGDSADLDSDQDQIKAWIGDIRSAVAQLRSRSGASQICILGVRIGALLASVAAANCPEVQAVASIAPLLSGKRYIRDLRITKLASQLRISPDQVPESVSGSPGESALEISGFALNSMSLDTLSTLDVAGAESLAFSHALIIDSRNVPASEQWAAQLRAKGCAVRQELIPGATAIPLTAPQFGEMPARLLDCVADWLAGLPQSPEQPALHRVAGPVLGSLKLSPPAGLAASPLHGPGSEVSVRIDSAVPLHGILTQPGVAERRRRAVIFINAAADYHIGAGRMYVSLARRWAASGYYVLRFDLAGLGDSAKRPGCPNDQVFPSAAMEDVEAAIRFLKSNYRIGDITLVGLCSGGYHALRAAIAGLPVGRIMLINPLNYFWKEGTGLRDIQPAEIVGGPMIYRERLLAWHAWKNLVTGKVDVWRIAKLYVHRVALAVESWLRDLARRMKIRLSRDLGAELEGLAARGVRTVFVFARGEPGLDLLRLLAGSSVARLGDACRIHVIDSGDHSFGRRAQRSIMEDTLSYELFAPVAEMTRDAV